MIHVVSSTSRTGISMSAQGFIRPMRIAGIDHQFVPYAEFVKNTQAYLKERCLIIPIPSAWRFKLAEKAPFINVFVCESNVVPQADQDRLSMVEHIWCPSTFCSTILNNHGIVNDVLPFSFELPKRARTQNQEHFTFLCSFDGKFSIHRKGVIDTIYAFRQAFIGVKDVRLKIKTFEMNSSRSEYLHQLIANDDRISIHNKFYDNTDEIYDDVNCYVSLHASEGFGMHLAEALYRGLPLIATNYGGCTDFCTPNTATLIDGVMTDHNVDSQYQWEGKWMQPDTKHAAKAMQDVFRNESSALVLAENGRKLMSENYSDEVVAKKLQERL